MDIRRFHVYVDGRRLPRWFLPDSDTQLGVRSDLCFDGCVERFDARREEWGSVHPDDLYDPGLPAFAQLRGHTLSLRLREAQHAPWGVDTAVRLASAGTNLHWQRQGAGNEVLDFGNQPLWWELSWDQPYVIYVDYFGARSQMTFEVRPCRIPLRDRSGELNL